ncbi:AI-2E family transporter [Xylanimonas sp. McL0601]|uniref:AI-2E family transporter n=1 Tax=Xylanimonas sp. McL0601 TaxID=3414739 RepID=UPI003CEA837C
MTDERLTLSPEARRVVAARHEGDAGAEAENVPQWLRTSAGWSWRFVALVAAVSLLVFAVVHVRLVFVAVFLALVMTSVLKPLADLYSRVMPRGLAVALSLLSAFVFVGGLVTYVVASVAGQWQSLADQFTTGIDQIISWVQHGPLPFDFSRAQIDDAIASGHQWVADNSANLATTAVASAGTVAQAFAVLALSIFCTVFFLISGGGMWRWFLGQVPAGHRGRWDDAAAAGWFTFSGYARGTVIIAVTDGILAGILLAALGIPLAAPLAVLVFIGAFIPLIGAPLAMVIAAVVALAAEGPVKALAVTIGIALIGQLEGHVLQPLIMGKQVALHPVVIALGVTAGTVLAGILGAVVAVPVMAVTWTVYSRLRPRPDELDEPPPEDGGGDGAAAGA